MFSRIISKFRIPRRDRTYEKVSAKIGNELPNENWLSDIFSSKRGDRKSNRRVDDEGPAPMPQIRGMQGMLKDMELAVQRGMHCWNMTQMKDAINSMEFFFNQVKANYDQLERLKDQQIGKPTQEELEQTNAQVARVLEKDDYSHGYGKLSEGVSPADQNTIKNTGA